MNLGNLRTEAQRLAGRVDTDWNTRTRRFLNEAQEVWAMAIPWPGLSRIETFTNFGTRSMILPQYVKQINWAADRSNKQPLWSRDHWDREFPDSYFGDVNGAAKFIRERGFVPCVRQPTGGVLTFKTDASYVVNGYAGGLVQDTTSSGTANFQYFAHEQISLSSSNVVSGTQVFSRIDILGKDDFTPADVIVRDASSNVIARIPALSYRAEYREIQLMEIPTSGTLIDFEYLIGPAPLVQDYQHPPPSVDPDYLIWYAAGLIHKAQGQEDQARSCLGKAQQLLEQRIHKERGHGDKDWRVLIDPRINNNEDQYVAGFGP